MTSRQSREAAFSDLVGGLLDARTDPATDRFDAELSAAEDDGRIDPQTAKVLRWWQREAQRAMVEHAQAVLPTTLLALEQAASGADREVRASAASWARAVADEPSQVPPVSQRPDPPAAGSHDRPAAARRPDEEPLTPPADLSEHRRRLLVAGLTRVRQHP
jgi:hypothetical protein